VISGSAWPRTEVAYSRDALDPFLISPNRPVKANGVLKYDIPHRTNHARGSHALRQSARRGPRFRRPWRENKSGARGLTTRSAEIRPGLLIAPKFGPRSISTRSACVEAAAPWMMRQNVDVTRNARSSPSLHFGQTSESVSSKRERLKSPTSRETCEPIRSMDGSAMSPPLRSGSMQAAMVRLGPLAASTPLAPPHSGTQLSDSLADRGQRQGYSGSHPHRTMRGELDVRISVSRERCTVGVPAPRFVGTGSSGDKPRNGTSVCLTADTCYNPGCWAQSSPFGAGSCRSRSASRWRGRCCRARRR